MSPRHYQAQFQPGRCQDGGCDVSRAPLATVGVAVWAEQEPDERHDQDRGDQDARALGEKPVRQYDSGEWQELNPLTHNSSVYPKGSA